MADLPRGRPAPESAALVTGRARAFYFSADSLVAARLASGPAFRVAEQHSLLPSDAYAPNFDLLPDGAFLMIRVAAPQPGAMRAMMLERWDPAGAR